MLSIKKVSPVVNRTHFNNLNDRKVRLPIGHIQETLQKDRKVRFPTGHIQAPQVIIQTVLFTMSVDM
jgi:hypothetical protein